MPKGFSGNCIPGVELLLDNQQYRPLLHTLETYLDLAGSVVATSRALRLHRTSLHLSIKLARL